MDHLRGVTVLSLSNILLQGVKQLGFLPRPYYPRVNDMIKGPFGVSPFTSTPQQIRIIGQLIRLMCKNKLKVNDMVDVEGKGGIILNLIKGSSGWYFDRGFGLLLNWLISVDWESGSRSWMRHPQIITEGEGSIATASIDVEGVFLFDSDKGYAWVSNWDCALIQIPVQPIK